MLLIFHEPTASLDVETGYALFARHAVAVRATVSEHNRASVPRHLESGTPPKVPIDTQRRPKLGRLLGLLRLLAGV